MSHEIDPRATKPLDMPSHRLALFDHFEECMTFYAGCFFRPVRDDVKIAQHFSAGIVMS